MENRKPMTNLDGEVRELTGADLQAGVSYEVLPDSLKAKLVGVQRKRGRPATKQLISLRLDTDVIDHFRATGPGWESRINEALKKTMPSRS